MLPMTRKSNVVRVTEPIHLFHLGKQYSIAHLYFEFSMTDNMSSNNLVVPSSGIAIPLASENGVYWGRIKTLNGLGTIDVSSLGGDYERPSIGGIVEQLKVSLMGITGANFYRVTIQRS